MSQVPPALPFRCGVVCIGQPWAPLASLELCLEAIPTQNLGCSSVTSRAVSSIATPIHVHRFHTQTPHTLLGLITSCLDCPGPAWPACHPCVTFKARPPTLASVLAFPPNANAGSCLTFTRLDYSPLSIQVGPLLQDCPALAKPWVFCSGSDRSAD